MSKQWAARGNEDRGGAGRLGGGDGVAEGDDALVGVRATGLSSPPPPPRVGGLASATPRASRRGGSVCEERKAPPGGGSGRGGGREVAAPSCDKENAPFGVVDLT